MNKDSKLLAEAYDKVGNENLSDEELAGRDPRIVNDNEKAYYLIKSGAWSLEDFETYLYEIEAPTAIEAREQNAKLREIAKRAASLGVGSYYAHIPKLRGELDRLNKNK